MNWDKECCKVYVVLVYLLNGNNRTVPSVNYALWAALRNIIKLIDDVHNFENECKKLIQSEISQLFRAL